MYQKAAIGIVLLLGFGLSAQTIALSGKVTDQSGKAIHGAEVKLLARNMSATTDASGRYSLTGTAVMRSAPNQTSSHTLSLCNNVLTVNLIQPSPVQIELFDIRGNLLERAGINPASAGNHRFALAKLPAAATMVVMRVSVGQQTTSFRHFVKSGSAHRFTSSTPVSTSARLVALPAALDSLLASAAGYKARKVPITSYSATVDFILESSFTGTCTASKSVNMTVSGSGPHRVVVETNADPGIREGTIYRPEDLGPGKKYPIFIWGEGACSLDGKSNSTAMAEIASHGYFVIADGTPGGTGGRPMDLAQIIKPARAYITWAIAENGKPCSAYYLSLDTSKVAGNGFSCGGFFGMAVAGDPRTTTWGLSSSGSFGNNPEVWNAVHTPVLIEEGHKDATGAYTNGLRDFNGIAPLGWPVYFISNKNYGHGGDLWDKNGGHFTRINLAWLNWWLKGDTGATGKGVLVGSGCTYCTDSNWEVKLANIQ